MNASAAGTGRGKLALILHLPPPPPALVPGSSPGTDQRLKLWVPLKFNTNNDANTVGSRSRSSVRHEPAGPLSCVVPQLIDLRDDLMGEELSLFCRREVEAQRGSGLVPVTGSRAGDMQVFL